MLRGKGKTLNAYIRKEEKVNNLSFYLSVLKKKNKINLIKQKENNDNIRHQ